MSFTPRIAKRPKIVKLDVGTGAYQEEILDEGAFLKGGRALSSSLVAELVPPGADALGPDNILAFCCGIMAGTTVTNGNRISVGGKSPLTGTIKESNAGGTFAYHKGRLGIRSIVCTGTQAIKPLDKERFKDASRTIAELVNNTPQTAKVFRKFGTAAMVDVGQGLGFLPVNNFTRGRFDQAEQINGQALYDTISSRGGEGKTTHACMPGCLIQCSNVYPDKEGKFLVSPLEYETIGLLGPNLGIANFDVIAELNRIANDSGVDTVDSGAAIGVAMQAGLAEFGDSDAALAMMKEIRQGTVLGRLLGSGAETTAKVLGIYQAPTAKGQAFPAYDPRALKGLAATYATSPMGADHTAGHTIRAAVEDHHGFKGQADASRLAQIGTLQWDSLGFCYFLGTALPDLSLLCELVKAIHGKEITPVQIRTMAVETLKTERDFNRKAGFGPAQNCVSEYFHKVENPDTGTVCDIPSPDIIELMDDNKLVV